MVKDDAGSSRQASGAEDSGKPEKRKFIPFSELAV